MSLLCFKIVSMFFLFLIPFTFSLSFNFSSFGKNETNRLINITGDASISNQGIQLTPDEGNVDRKEKAGRATYFELLHLWDKSSRNLSDFFTHFSFVIDSNGSLGYGDGLAFFLAPAGSGIPVNATHGGLGLARGDDAENSSTGSFFAVEFDTYLNSWDPLFTHVGIDINSVKSVTTFIWSNNFTLGVENEAWIDYNATSKTLSVNYTGFSYNTTQQGSLTYVVDLRDYLPEFVTFGFSASTGYYFERNTVKSWEFSSKLQHDISSEPTITSGFGTEKKRPGVLRLAVGIGVGLLVLILLLAFSGYFLWKRRYKKGSDNGEAYVFDPSMDSEFEKGSGAKKFSFNELVLATNNFDERLKLGEGGFGGVYRGYLKDSNSYVAVKRVSRGSNQGVNEYAAEVKIISQLRHRNLVQIIGWCHERGELLLVYEFLPNGSLNSHLFDENSVMAWEIRYKIAQGLASALLYLHEEWEQCVVHRDIKSSNVMLDSNFNVKLGDFGLARFVDHETELQMTMIAGTYGYMAPECLKSGRVSKESDVYSFGVVLLEIACGRKAIVFRLQENQVILVQWVWDLYGKGNLLSAADPKLFSDYEAREMELLMIVGLWCAHPDYRHRPSMKQAISVINFETTLPTLPSKMPAATYDSPTMSRSASLNSQSSSTSIL